MSARKAAPRPQARQTAPKSGAKSTSKSASSPDDALLVERVQTGVRLEKRILKVLKGIAELRDLSLSDLLEGIVLHAFAGKTPFSPETMTKIAELKRIYGLELDASHSHRLRESK